MLPNVNDKYIQYRKRLITFWDGYAEQQDIYTMMFLKRNNWVGKRLQLLFPMQRNLKIADIGTGAGFLAISYAELGHEVVATDISTKMLKLAEKNAKERNLDIKFQEDDILETALPKNHFDLVVLRDVYSSIFDCRKLFANVFRLLNPGGYIMISDGNYFLHHHDDLYRRRHEYYLMKYHKDEYERSLAMDHATFTFLSSLLFELEVNCKRRPVWDSELALELNMNNVRFRTDDREPFFVLTEHGKVEVPLRYTFVAQKGVLGELGESTPSPDKAEISLFYSSDNVSEKGIASVFQMLSYPERISIIRFLDSGDKTVSEIAAHLNLSINKASYHLNSLKESKMVCSKKVGRTVQYSLAESVAEPYLIFLASEICSHR